MTKIFKKDLCLTFDYELCLGKSSGTVDNCLIKPTYELAEIIENASDPTSEDYLRVSASWELGFTEFNIAVAEGEEKNIENAELITDNEKVQEELRVAPYLQRLSSLDFQVAL